MDTKPINQANMNIDQAISTGKTTQRALEKVAEEKSDQKAKVDKGSAAQVALSSNAKELAEAHSKALDIALNTPEVNEAKVQDLKDRIKNGTYKINAAGIADGMLKEAVLDRLAETER